ncbi:proline-, glutamic acid- and leucine-rich protein 1 [Lasioglossum baleicum]|uniref:proline-, glutamic acid- and leucine-rich protein 1 n=1 Tax=Lasioglossum baleicum TaxID=434251 RepID=UPI003FCC9BA7
MATIVELINFYDHTSKEYEELLQDLLCSNGDIPLSIEEVDEAQSIIISTINNYLNKATTRYKGLLILDKSLSQYSKDTISKYCILWMSKATQILESIHSVPQELNISCKVLGQLIIQTKEIQEIQKQVSMQNVKQLINAVSNLHSDRQCGSLYYLIAILLHYYPEVCERFQVAIRNLILPQIDSTQDNLVNSSARCYALLAKATERSFKPPASKPTYTGWLYHQALVCNSLHTVMDVLFSSLIELENVSIWDKLELPNISEENIIQFYFKQKQRFLNLCSYLSCMLRGFDKKNSVLPNDILKVLCRGLAIQPSNLKKQDSIRGQMLYLILPQLHMALFNVLDALINGFKEQLIPFGSTILQLFLQLLQWTETVLENKITLSGEKPYKNVRISVYKCLTSWLVNTNSLSGVETIADEYLPSILKDIVPEKDCVLLTIQKTHNLSKRALKRLRDSQYEKGAYLTNGLTSGREHYLDIDICKSSLNALQHIFLNGGTCLKQTFFKTIQNIIIPLLYDCYLSSAEQKFYKENPDCRLELLRLLRALQMSPHCLVPLPTQYSLEIFEMALRDNDLCIIQEAKIALAELEKIVHPHAPPIQLTQVETIQKEFIPEGEIAEHNEREENAVFFDTENVTVEDTEASSNRKNEATVSHTESTLDEDMIPSNEKSISVVSHSEESILYENITPSSNKKSEATISHPEKSVQDDEMAPSINIQNKTIISHSEENEAPVSHTEENILDDAVIPSQNRKNKATIVHPEESIVDDDLAPSSNKRLKVADARLDKSVEPEVAQEQATLENKKEEEEMLQFFQDIPKTDD